LTFPQLFHIVYEMVVVAFASVLENAAIFCGAKFQGPVKGLFAGDGAVIPNSASDILPYVGRKLAPG